MPNPKKSSTADKPIWVGIAGKKELRDLYTALLTTVIAGEWHDYEEMRTTSSILKGMATVRTNDKDRLLIHTIQKKEGNYIVIMEEILEHDHDKCMYLKPDVTNKPKEERFQKLIDGLKDSDFVTITLSKSMENPNPETTATLPPPQAFYPEYAHLLTPEQRNALELRLPCRVEASAGFGKTSFAAVYLKKVMDSLIESLQAMATIAEMDRQRGYEEKEEKVEPIDLVYVAKTEKLVQDFGRGYQALPGAKTNYLQASVSSKTIKQLAHENLEQPNLDGKRISIDKPAFARWLIGYQKIEANKEKGHGKAGARGAIDRTRIFEKPTLLYTELCYMVMLTEAEYLERGINVRGTKEYFKAEERPFLWQLCKDYIKHMLNKGQYDLSLNPPPLRKSFLHTIVIDEVQGLSPKLIEILLSFSSNRQFLLLYGLHQSLYLCNRQYIQVHNIPRVLFTKSLRNPHAVTLMANNVLRAQKCFGEPDKEDRSEFMEPNQDIQGKIYWGGLSEIPEPLMNGKDASLTIVTREEHVEEAKAKFKTPCVYTAEELQGTDCENLLLYKMSDAPIFDYISACLSAEAVVSTGHRAKASAHTSNKYSLGEIHSAFDEFQIALTRATQGRHEVRIFENTSRHRNTWLQLLKNGVPISAFSEEKAETPHESSLEEWLARAEKVFREEENEDAAKDILESLPKKFPKTFGRKEAATILASWRSSEDPSTPTTLAPSRSLESKEPATQGSSPTAPKVGVARPSLTKVPTDIVKKYTNFNFYKNQKSFTALFDHKHCTELLFASVGEKGGCLFAYFMEDEELARLFREAFINSAKYKEKIPASLLSGLTEQADFDDSDAPLLCLTKNVSSMALFEYLVDKVPSFAEGVSYKALFKKFKDPEGKIPGGLTIYQQLSKSPFAKKVLAKLSKILAFEIAQGQSLAYESQAISLFTNFNESQLMTSLPDYNFENLFLTTYTHKGTPFALIERLHSDEQCRIVFSSCLINHHPKLLLALPLEKMPNPLQGNNLDKAWDGWLEKLKRVRDTFIRTKIPFLTEYSEMPGYVDDCPLLHIAVATNLEKSIFRDIKELGGDLNITGQKAKVTAAHVAIKQNRLKYLAILKDLGMDLTLLDAGGHSLMHLVTRMLSPDGGVLTFMKELAPTLSLTQASEIGTTPAYCALQEDNASMLLEIKKIEPSFDIRQPLYFSDYTTTLLHEAASLGKLKTIKALRKIDPQLSLSETLNGFSPLHLAAMKGHVEVISLLRELEPSLDLNQPAKDGATAAFQAVVHRQFPVLGVLKKLDPNVSLNKPNDIGLTPVYLAVQTRDVELLDFLERQNVSLSDERNTEHHLGNLAVKNEDLTILGLLVDMGYDMTIPGKVSPGQNEEQTPLTLAQSLKNTEVIGFLEMLNQAQSKEPRAASPSLKNSEHTFFNCSLQKAAVPTSPDLGSEISEKEMMSAAPMLE